MLRWIKSLSLIFLISLLILIVGSALFLSQKLKQAEITNLTWSLNHLSLTSLKLEKISATYQQRLHIKLENVQIHWTDIDTWFDSFFQITALSIENAQLQLSSHRARENQAENIEIPVQFSWPKTSEEWQTNTFLIGRFPWLSLLPKATEIKHFSLSRDCPAGLCTLVGQLEASLESTSTTQQGSSLQARLQGNLANQNSPDNSLSFQLKAALSPEELPSLQVQLLLDKSLNLTLNNNITSDNQLTTSLQLSGLVPTPIWFKTLENWTGFSLSEAALLQLQQQALSPVKIDAINSLPLASVDILIQQFTTHVAKTENPKNAEDSSITLSPERLSQISTQLEINIELPQPTPIPAIGLLQGLLKAKLKLQQGVLQDYQLHTSGILSKHFITEKLQSLELIKGVDISNITFELNSQRTSPTNSLTSLPFDLSFNSVPPSANKSLFSLFGQGILSFAKEPDFTKPNITKPNLILQSGLFSLQQDFLTIQPSVADTSQYRISNLKAVIPFTADYHNQSLTLKTDNADIKGDLQLIEPSKPDKMGIKLSQSSLQFKTLNFDLKQADIAPLTWSLSSKQVILKTQFSSPLLKAKNLQISLNALQLNHSANGILVDPLQIKANYRVTTSRLGQLQLLPQYWSAKGSVEGGVNHLQLAGSISNAAELTIQHKSLWKNQRLSSDWLLQPVFFLASNPLQKSFTSWPSELTLASGQMALKGKLSLNTKTLKDPLAALSATMNGELKQVSGLYQQTAFNQVSSLTNASLSNKQFKLSLPSLNITQVNHGLIAGPINMNALYQGSISHPLRGLLNIKTLESGLFNGQAWLDPQTIDLSATFQTQLHLKDIDIEELLKQHPTSNLKGKGLIDGFLPLQINLTREPAMFLIKQGQVSSQPKGGLLQYQPATKSALGKTNQSMQLVLDVLDDFHYSVLQSSVSIDEHKKMHLGLTLKGQNPKVEHGRAINLNINLEEDLPSLITSMQITNQVSETIKRRVQEKIKPPSKVDK